MCLVNELKLPEHLNRSLFVPFGPSSDVDILHGCKVRQLEAVFGSSLLVVELMEIGVLPLNHAGSGRGLEPLEVLRLWLDNLVSAPELRDRIVAYKHIMFVYVLLRLKP